MQTSERARERRRLGVRLGIIAMAAITTFAGAQVNTERETRAVVIHRAGPRMAEIKDPRTSPIVLGHRDYWARLAAEGKTDIGGRVTGGATPEGLTIFTRGFDLDEARRLALDEPAVRDGYMVAEFRVLTIAPFFAKPAGTPPR